MRFFKYLLLFALPILIFVNLWRASNGIEGASGFQFAMDYTSTYRGWQSTVGLFEYLYGLGNVDNVGEGILLILSPAWAPIAFVVSILADLIYHVGFFFGWLMNGVFESDLINYNANMSSSRPDPFSWPWTQQISFVPLNSTIGVKGAK